MQILNAIIYPSKIWHCILLLLLIVLIDVMFFEVSIFSIPSSLLIDPQGKIVAMDLRGKKLGDKLREIYGE